MIHVLHFYYKPDTLSISSMPLETLAYSRLLLVDRIPAKPVYFRVKIWRRLQGVGAIAVKYALHARSAPLFDQVVARDVRSTKETEKWQTR